MDRSLTEADTYRPCGRQVLGFLTTYLPRWLNSIAARSLLAWAPHRFPSRLATAVNGYQAFIWASGADVG